jgi:hypothetical protein
MSKENWDDKTFVLEQVQKNSYALIHASKILQDDEEVVQIVAIEKEQQKANERLLLKIDFFSVLC